MIVHPQMISHDNTMLVLEDQLKSCIARNSDPILAKEQPVFVRNNGKYLVIYGMVLPRFLLLLLSDWVIGCFLDDLFFQIFVHSDYWTESLYLHSSCYHFGVATVDFWDIVTAIVSFWGPLPLFKYVHAQSACSLAPPSNACPKHQAYHS